MNAHDQRHYQTLSQISVVGMDEKLMLHRVNQDVCLTPTNDGLP